MIQYSIKALRALPHFFKHYNDIDVYVEDTVTRNFYEVLFNRILDGKAKVTKVFQMGGRAQVIAECRRQQSQLQRATIFVIDGDFELVSGDPAPALDNLYRLSVYCSENLLLCDNAVTELAYETLSNMPKPEVHDIVKFNEFTNSVNRQLQNLFITYATAFKLSSTIETSGFHVYQLCENHSGQPFLDRGKVRRRRKFISNSLKANHSPAVIRKEYEEVKARCKSNDWSALHVVSGKTYLLPLLFSYLRVNANYRGTVDTLKVQLARYCNLDIDQGLKDAVLKAAH